MSAEPTEGQEFTQEELDARYARIAELRSQELRLQQELIRPGGQGRAPADHGEHRPGHRAVDQDPRPARSGKRSSSACPSWRTG